MVEPIPNSDTDFSAQLQALVIEAEQSRESHVRAKSEPVKSPANSNSELQGLLRPIVAGLESLQYSQNEHIARLTAASASVPQALADARQALESRNVVSKAMFEALHAELKSYKDAFILESVLRPVIRDLLGVYDSMSEIFQQLSASMAAFDVKEMADGAVLLVENMRQAATNLDHNIHFILEVLERLDVTPLPIQIGKLDKRTQKAMTVEATEDKDQDNDIAKVLRRGFQWKERIIRPEEVIIKKWKEPPPEPETTSVTAT